jgi:hypothetical protein
MSRRNPGLFDTLGKMLFENVSGRIRWRSNMWALVGGKWDKNRLRNPNLIDLSSPIVNSKGEFEKDGRVLVGKSCTLCPSAPEEEGFYFDGKWFWVPAVACRKCQWHRKRSSARGFGFPRCTFKRAETKNAVAKETLVQFGSMLDEAKTKAEKILKGEPLL